MQGKRNSGFTMMEVLLTVAVLVILLAITIIPVATYKDGLKITELDNAAREIYMAAQNRATLLSGAQRLTALVYEVDATTGLKVGGLGEPVTLTNTHGHVIGEDCYVVYKNDLIDGATNLLNSDLLTNNSIDAALHDAKVDFCIVYDLNSGSVTDVFYAESKLDDVTGAVIYPLSLFIGDKGGFQNFYTENNGANWPTDNHSSRLQLYKNDPDGNMLVGYYGGNAASQIATPTPTVWIPVETNVKINNGEILTVTVDYIPETGATPIVTLSDGEHSVELKYDSTNPTSTKNATGWVGKTSGSYTYQSCTWVLDCLQVNPAADGKLTLSGLGQLNESYEWKNLNGSENWSFRNLFGGITAGKDISVSVSYSSSSPYVAFFARNTLGGNTEDVNNSLFEGINGTTAKIKYLRHLQNLDDGSGDNDCNGNDYNPDPNSGIDPSVWPITVAVQTNNISGVGKVEEYNDGTSVTYYPNYEFTPISNSTLKEYNGSDKQITGLTVVASDNDAGLFEYFGDENSADRKDWRIHDVNLINVKVRNGKNAGALVGKAEGCTIESCELEWKQTTDNNDEDKPSSWAADYADVNVQSDGGNAGGLVGWADNCTMDKCYTTEVYVLASKDNNNAGGLVGQADNCTIQNCDTTNAKVRTDKAVSFAGGLVGAANSSTINTCKMINTTVSSQGYAGGMAGALIGDAVKGTSCDIDKCQVYWEGAAGISRMKTAWRDFPPALTSGITRIVADTDNVRYQIYGNTAGGLVGLMSVVTGADPSQKYDTCATIDDSLAATLVYGSTYAGGLIGKVDDGAEPRITKAYADCYLIGDGNIAGLAGLLAEEGSVYLVDCYAAGYIESNGNKWNQTAGLCMGEGKSHPTRVYSAMNYYGWTDGSFVPHYLTQDLSKGPETVGDDFNQAYYFDVGFNLYRCNGRTTELLTTNTKEQLAAELITADAGCEFEMKDNATSPYNLRVELPNVYEYPGLKGLPHYGDWAKYVLPTPPTPAIGTFAVVYYEWYGGTNYAFYGIDNLGNTVYNKEATAGALMDGKTNSSEIQSSGYALASLKSDFVTAQHFNGASASANVSTKNVNDVTKVTVTNSVAFVGGVEVPIVYNSTDTAGTVELLTNVTIAAPATSATSFYQEVTFKPASNNSDGFTEGKFCLNSDFARTVKSLNNGESIEPYNNSVLTAITGTETTEYDTNFIHIRTVDQLKKLNEANYRTGHNYYQEHALTLSGTWSPIGTDDSNGFTGIYDGGGHKITGLYITLTRGYTNQFKGLFGCVGSGGYIQNVDVTVSIPAACDRYSGTSHSDGGYIGGIVGYNSGTVRYCVSSGSITTYIDAGYENGAQNAYARIGGVVGYNANTVEGCTNNVSISNTLDVHGAMIGNKGNGYVYIGGVVGHNANGASVNNCGNTASISSINYNRQWYGDRVTHLGAIVGLNNGSVKGYTNTGSPSDIVGYGNAAEMA